MIKKFTKYFKLFKEIRSEIYNIFEAPLEAEANRECKNKK